MQYEFRNDIITHVPTACLIEDIQKLNAALNRGDIEDAMVTIDCLAEAIDKYTEVPDGLEIKPSSTSIIAMGCQPGIIVSNGKDLKCAYGHPVSSVMAGGCCQCDENCPHFNAECYPEYGVTMLEGGFIYDGSSEREDALIKFLDDYTEKE